MLVFKPLTVGYPVSEGKQDVDQITTDKSV